VSARRLLPRRISVAVLGNLHESLVPLIYSTIAPASFLIYLHPDDYAAIEGIAPMLRGQIDRALDETTERLNHPHWWMRVLHPAREPLPPIEPTPRRSIEILPDPNAEVALGEVGVHSELRLPTVGEYAGSPTVRVTMTTTAGAPPRRHDLPLATPTTHRGAASLTIEDLEGRRQHELVDNPTLVGRGGLGCYVHVRLRADGQVSKEHCRIRRDDESGTFFIKDLSRNGTSLNGERLPCGVEFIDGQKREINGAEVPLPDGARIALADVLQLEFRRDAQ
jgi:hypothetical protein